MSQVLAESLLFHFLYPHRNQGDRYTRSAARTEIHRLVRMLRAFRN